MNNIESKNNKYKLSKKRFKLKQKFCFKRIVPSMLPFVIIAVLLIIFPIVGMIFYSIIKPRDDIMIFKFSLENFIRLLQDGDTLLILGLSILYAFIASVIAVILAYPVAYCLSTMRSKKLASNMWILITLPIWINMLVKIIGLNSLFKLLGGSILGTQFAIVIGMVYMFLPFAISPIYNSLENQDPIYVQAALDLKATKMRAFWTITFKNSVPGVITGFILVLIQATTSLLIAKYMGDGKITLITSILESYFLQGESFGYGAAIAIVLAILTFILIIIMNTISKKFEKGARRGKNKWKTLSDQVI